MIIEEIELPIEGNRDNIEKILLNNNFEIFYKVLTITDYYLPIIEDESQHFKLKEKCKRLRYVEPVCKFENKWQNYKEWIKHYDLKECIKEEKKIIDEGYKKIYTDVKTDYVYKNMLEDDMYFQIQDIKNDCLMIAYDNKKYYNIERKMQRKLLIQDVTRFGIKILSENNIDRFRQIGNILEVVEIINIMEKQLLELNESILEKCIPKYLERDLTNLKEGLKSGVNYIDCLINELQGSINSAFIDGDISEEQCDYLYKKYIRMEIK